MDGDLIVIFGPASTVSAGPSEPALGIFSYAITGESSKTVSGKSKEPEWPVERSSRAGTGTKGATRSKALTRKLEDAFHLALRLEEALRPTERYVLVDELLGKVELAIRERADSERPLLKLLLLIQGSLEHLEAEALTSEQLRALREAIGILRIPRLTELDLNDARKLLIRAGLDPSRPLGGVFPAPA